MTFFDVFLTNILFGFGVLVFCIAVLSLKPKKHHPKNVDIIISQARSRTRQ
ncbi:putative membrane protein [Salmonella phage P46FS4]|uniref:Putative membrane protein n=1 Tax=Salmonella phage P46FS4 TaxID=2712940 RepID=A0A6G6XTP4_9CAUD|nr:hypothetical protein HYQ39_gp136 [Salmonella phage P46FS4]QIG62202.1 putative membrane protein [Salmonella phage P46FS4]